MGCGLVHGRGMVQQQLVCTYFGDQWSSSSAVCTALLFNSHTLYSTLIYTEGHSKDSFCQLEAIHV